MHVSNADERSLLRTSYREFLMNFFSINIFQLVYQFVGRRLRKLARFLPFNKYIRRIHLMGQLRE